MTSRDLIYAPLESPTDERARAVERIYAESFLDDERIPFEKLFDLFTRPVEGIRVTLGAFEQAGEVVALGSASYHTERNLGYLAYLAVRADLRSRGFGAQVVRSLLDWADGQARESLHTSSRFTFWEVRHPAAAATPEERRQCERRIRFYEGLGARTIPITYVCPPIGPGLPEVVDLPMAYTYPPGRSLSRTDVLDLAWQGVVLINGAKPDSDYWAQTLRSVDELWPE